MGETSIDESKNIVLASDALLQELSDGEAVILHMGSEVYYALDGIALSMWKAIGDAGSLGEAREQLSAMYEVDAQTLARDLDDLVRELEERGLVEIV